MRQMAPRARRATAAMMATTLNIPAAARYGEASSGEKLIKAGQRAGLRGAAQAENLGKVQGVFFQILQRAIVQRPNLGGAQQHPGCGAG